MDGEKELKEFVLSVHFDDATLLPLMHHWKLRFTQIVKVK